MIVTVERKGRKVIIESQSEDISEIFDAFLSSLVGVGYDFEEVESLLDYIKQNHKKSND